MIPASPFRTGSSGETPTKSGRPVKFSLTEMISAGAAFALHANLFRYAMLHQLGGWWTDHDVVLLRRELPPQDFFFSLETHNPMRVTFSVLKFPAGHPALAEALARCVAVGDSPLYGETRTDLLTDVVAKHQLAHHGQAMETTYPLSALDVPAIFDPASEISCAPDAQSRASCIYSTKPGAVPGFQTISALPWDPSSKTCYAHTGSKSRFHAWKSATCDAGPLTSRSTKSFKPANAHIALLTRLSRTM